MDFKRRGCISTKLGVKLFTLFFFCFLFILMWDIYPANTEFMRFTWTIQPKIFFVITTSIFNVTTQGETDVARRKRQYKQGIKSLINATNRFFNSTDKMQWHYHILIVENNGPRGTFLDDFVNRRAPVSVLYTNNNNSPNTSNKGMKELLDIQACIEHYHMQPQDLIVKMTGRYFLDKFVTNFMQNVAAVSKQTWMSGQSNKATMAIMKYGTFTKPKNSPRDEVVTGLIMLPVFVIRAMPDCDQSHRLYGYTENTSNVETTFAKCAQEMIGVGTNQYNIHAVQGKMGVWVRPARFKHYRMI
mmetsp:Transcript_16285/g.37508  ORF Transcript_16285/g.37508 Transcript_16285/m.37508 type:complete len:301 (+) Transcript_16285:2-904(+)